MEVQVEALDKFLDESLIHRAVETGEVELPVHEEAVVAWILHGADRQKYDVNAAELSETGLVLFLDQRLPRGVWAKINMRCGIVFGRISDVAPCLDGGYRVSIRVDELLPR